MHARPTLLVAGLTLAVAVPTAIAAKPAPKPPKPATGATALTLVAKPDLVVFTQNVALSGRLTGAGSAAGTTLRLEADSVAPLGDRFVTTGKTTVAASNGNYGFTVAPGVNTQYRVVTASGPAATSPARSVRVRPLVGLTTSTAFPRKGALVRFSGSVRPVHTTLLVSIQRRTSTGRWGTVTKTALKPATALRSSYSRSIRIRASGVYRVVLPAHNDNTTGISRERTLTVR